MAIKTLFPFRLDYYQSCIETWTGIFSALPLQSHDAIVDICPGWAPKIELALMKNSFIGSVTAWDISEKNLVICKSFVEQFPISFDVHFQKGNILNKTLLRNVHIIAGNHILDDLAIETYCQSKRKNSLPFYTNISKRKELWKTLQSSSQIVNSVTKKFTGMVKTMLATDGYLLLSQYPSYQDKLYGTFTEYQVCARMLTTVKQALVISKDFIDGSGKISEVFRTQDTYFCLKDFLCLRRSG